MKMDVNKMKMRMQRKQKKNFKIEKKEGRTKYTNVNMSDTTIKWEKKRWKCVEKKATTFGSEKQFWSHKKICLLE